MFHYAAFQDTVDNFINLITDYRFSKPDRKVVILTAPNYLYHTPALQARLGGLTPAFLHTPIEDSIDTALVIALEQADIDEVIILGLSAPEAGHLAKCSVLAMAHERNTAVYVQVITPILLMDRKDYRDIAQSFWIIGKEQIDHQRGFYYTQVQRAANSSYGAFGDFHTDADLKTYLEVSKLGLGKRVKGINEQQGV